ncbi:hypothetical protein HXZ66_06995 [Bacillus sp. A116_S68]|nr:hypothetical protein HXZ66_06995 [Bacillus sp. A116_S68]
MDQDVNKIIDVVSIEWSNQLSLAYKKIALLIDENERLKQENEQVRNLTTTE